MKYSNQHCANGHVQMGLSDFQCFAFVHQGEASRQSELGHQRCRSSLQRLRICSRGVLSAMLAFPRLVSCKPILRLSKCIMWSDRIVACWSNSQAGCYALQPHDAFVQTNYGWQVCKSGSGKYGREPMTAAVASNASDLPLCLSPTCLSVTCTFLCMYRRLLV